jgi:hypothetical protein
MTDQPAALDSALEQVIAAARSHLAAVKVADGAIDDEQVWRSYVALNNASYEYDQLLLEAYGEVTPWDTEAIDLREDEQAGALAAPSAEERAPDPYPSVISVRQRRDYRVPSVTALLAIAEQVTRQLVLDDEVPAPATVAEAVLGLVQAGDGSLAALDVPALEPLDGVVTVSEVSEPLDLATATEADGADLFRPGPGDRLVGRLDEHPYLELGDLDEDLDEEFDGAGESQHER